MTVSGSVLSPFQAARYERQTGTNCSGATYCLSVVFDERMNPPYLICELANSHGGDSAVLQNLVKAIKKIDYPRLGVKFQPFKPDTMSLPDYEWHTVYKQLYFSPHVWRHVIETAKSDVGDVWLDVFDQYGIDIAGEHLSDITGIKLQPSVLENQEVYRGLESFDLGHKILIVNVSGYCIDNIENIVAKFLCLEPSELVLQVGFQAYPTQAKDTALNKIAILRKRFSTQKLCFADHYEGDQLFACRVPLMATVLGCEFIEKHVCLSRTDAVYDFHSALEIRGLETLATELILASNCFSSKFVSEREAHYLVSTQQIPITKTSLRKGQLVSEKDLIYRRTGQSGLTKQSIDIRQKERFILKKAIGQHKSISESVFRPASIGTLVACRLDSSRLKRKALLPIQGISSVERCLTNCRLFPGVDVVVLTTSNLDEDSVLQDYTLNGEVEFWQGDPHDVIRRYVGACAAFEIDVVVRVTADCPVVSPEITEVLLERHFRSGADYTGVRNGAVGTCPEIYNAEALRRVLELVGEAKYAEYMTYYFTNNPDVFKVELVDLPPELIRNYRLTLDYEEDLELFERLYMRLDECSMEPNLYNVFSILDADAELASHNQHRKLKYKTDEDLVKALATETRIPRVV